MEQLTADILSRWAAPTTAAHPVFPPLYPQEELEFAIQTGGAPKPRPSSSHIHPDAVFLRLITNEPDAPYSGEHTAIQIPAGPKQGMWLHIPRSLDVKKIAAITSGISGSWKEWDPSNHGATINYAPKEYSVKDFNLVGPRFAPYPMTMSPIPPFKGPHTALFNQGSYFNGWYMHLPRYLAQEEMSRAERNLNFICEKPWAWGDKHGADPVKSFEKNHLHSVEVYGAQKRIAILLEKEAQIDFSVQKDFNGAWGPGPYYLWDDWDKIATLAIVPPPKSTRPALPNTDPRNDAAELQLSMPSGSGEDETPGVTTSDKSESQKYPGRTVLSQPAESSDESEPNMEPQSIEMGFSFPDPLSNGESTGCDFLSDYNEEVFDETPTHSSVASSKILPDDKDIPIRGVQPAPSAEKNTPSEGDVPTINDCPLLVVEVDTNIVKRTFQDAVEEYSHEENVQSVFKENGQESVPKYKDVVAEVPQNGGKGSVQDTVKAEAEDDVTQDIMEVLRQDPGNGGQYQYKSIVLNETSISRVSFDSRFLIPHEDDGELPVIEEDGHHSKIDNGATGVCLDIFLSSMAGERSICKGSPESSLFSIFNKARAEMPEGNGIATQLPYGTMDSDQSVGEHNVSNATVPKGPYVSATWDRRGSIDALKDLVDRTLELAEFVLNRQIPDVTIESLARGFPDTLSSQDSYDLASRSFSRRQTPTRTTIYGSSFNTPPLLDVKIPSPSLHWEETPPDAQGPVDASPPRLNVGIPSPNLHWEEAALDFKSLTDALDKVARVENTNNKAIDESKFWSISRLVEDVGLAFIAFACSLVASWSSVSVLDRYHQLPLHSPDACKEWRPVKLGDLVFTDRAYLFVLGFCLTASLTTYAIVLQARGSLERRRLQARVRNWATLLELVGLLNLCLTTIFQAQDYAIYWHCSFLHSARRARLSPTGQFDGNVVAPIFM